MLAIDKIIELIGTPFDQLKCWDLVAEVYRRSGITLSHYTQINMGLWEEVQEPVQGDVLVFALYGVELDHVGVYIGDGQFIHATEHSGTCIERLSRYRQKLKHMYRWGGGIYG